MCGLLGARAAHAGSGLPGALRPATAPPPPRSTMAAIEQVHHDLFQAFSRLGTPASHRVWVRQVADLCAAPGCDDCPLGTVPALPRLVPIRGPMPSQGLVAIEESDARLRLSVAVRLLHEAMDRRGSIAVVSPDPARFLLCSVSAPPLCARRALAGALSAEELEILMDRLSRVYLEGVALPSAPDFAEAGGAARRGLGHRDWTVLLDADGVAAPGNDLVTKVRLARRGPDDAWAIVAGRGMACATRA